MVIFVKFGKFISVKLIIVIVERKRVSENLWESIMLLINLVNSFYRLGKRMMYIFFLIIVDKKGKDIFFK